MSKISNTSTKSEILSAYEDLLEQIKNERKESTSLRQELEKKQKQLENADKASSGGATLSLQQLRKNLNDYLDKTETSLVEEQQKYEAMRQGVAVLKEELNTLHKIKAEAESLEALIIANRQASEKLERELESRRLALETTINANKKEREREQESYDYELKIKRRNEQDAYNEKKAKADKELADKKLEFDKTYAERESLIAAKESEFLQLRKEADAFEKRFEDAIKQTEQSATERLTKEFEYQQKIQVKDLEAELKLRDQMISSLELKIREQQELIASLSSKADLAGHQVKDIALKAIEKSGMVGFPVERRNDKES